MARHFILVFPQLERLAELLTIIILPKCCGETIFHASHCLSTCAHYMNLWLVTMQQQQEAKYEYIIVKCVSFWSHLIPVVMKYLNSSPDDIFPPIIWQINETLVNALSNIGAIMYENFPHSTQIKLLSYLSYIGNNKTTLRTYPGILVQAAAVRALAVYAMYPTLRMDLVFIENTAELTLCLVDNKNMLVRTKAFWSMGNISDALVLEYANNNNEGVSNDLLQRMVVTALKACNDNHKVHSNAVRILGNLLSLLNTQQLHTQVWGTLLLEASIKLQTSCLTRLNNAKTKWNSCYAIGTMLSNKSLFDKNVVLWQPQIYDTLCQAIVQDTNFKVRINATNAMQQISQRSHFFAYFEKFWLSLLDAIEQSNNLDNFYEYNHRDKLQQELCLAICHMLSLAELDDFPVIRKPLTERLEVVQSTWLRVTYRMVPEKAVSLMSCSRILLQKITSQHCSTQQSNIQFVAKTFNLDG